MTALVIPAYPVRAALGRFSEELASSAVTSATAAIEHETALHVGRWLVAQGKAVVSALHPAIGSQMDRGVAPRPAEWDYVIAQVMMRPYGGASQLGDILSGAHRRGYIAGSNVTRAQLGGKNPAFWLGNDDAAAYAKAHAAARVTQIDDTTRRELNRLIADAVERRLTWKETAALIEERYADMAGPPLFPSRKHRRRAQMIAAFETRDAYEAGGLAQAERLAASGMVVEKRWVFLRDGRARDAHRANGQLMWVPLDYTYADGLTRPPSDGNCRCVLMYRTMPGATAADDAGEMGDRALAWMMGDLPTTAGRYGTAVRPTDAHVSAVKGDLVRRLAEATGIPARHVNRFVRQWADTSNGDDNSMLIQQTAAQLFGVRPSAWQQRLFAEMTINALVRPDWRSPSLFADPGSLRMAPDVPFANDTAAVAALLRAMYAQTQAALQPLGSDRLHLYRGLVMDAAQAAGLSRGGPFAPDQNVLSSWSLLPGEALAFAAKTEGPGRVGVALAADVDVRHVLATARTGFGALAEMEVVVVKNSAVPVVMDVFGLSESAKALSSADIDVLNADWLAAVNPAARRQELRVLDRLAKGDDRG